jgi:hypothetical protein
LSRELPPLPSLKPQLVENAFYGSSPGPATSKKAANFDAISVLVERFASLFRDWDPIASRIPGFPALRRGRCADLVRPIAASCRTGRAECSVRSAGPVRLPRILRNEAAEKFDRTAMLP